MKKLFFVLIGLLMQVVLFAQPNWIDAEARVKLYPADKYFQSFQFVNIADVSTSNDALKKLSSDVLGTIAQSVMVSVKSNSLSKTVQKNDEIDREFVDNTLTESMVELAGVQQEQWFDLKKKIGYVFCFIEKQKLKEYYIGKFNLQINSSKEAILLGEKADVEGNAAIALKNFQNAFSILKQTGNTISIIQSVDVAFNVEEYFQLLAKTRAAISKLEKADASNLQSAASLIAHLLSVQVSEANVKLFPFTFQNTQLSGQLSQLLKDELMIVFMASGKLKPVSNNLNLGATYILRGSIWEIGDKLRISCLLLDTTNTKVMAAADVYLPKKWVADAGITWKPNNMDEVVKNMLEMQDVEGISNGIKLEVFTNKGNADLLFTEGETMELFIKVNHSCNLRMVYVFADGTQALLLDNFFIDPSLVNRIYKLPEQFKCMPPFGIENLKVFASTEQFEPLMVDDVSGYKIIKNKTNEVIKLSRGFKVVKNEVLKGETSLVITTMKK